MEQALLQKHYYDTVVPALKEKFGYSNGHIVPTVTKIVINSGFSATADKNHATYVLRKSLELRSDSRTKRRSLLHL